MADLKKLSDKISSYTDKYGVANPIEVLNEELGGETREESRKRRAMAPSMLAEPTTPEQKKMLREESTNLKPRSVDKETVKKYSEMKKGGKVSSASKRADGCAVKGKTKGRFV